MAVNANLKKMKKQIFIKVKVIAKRTITFNIDQKLVIYRSGYVNQSVFQEYEELEKNNEINDKGIRTKV